MPIYPKKELYSLPQRKLSSVPVVKERELRLNHLSFSEAFKKSKEKGTFDKSQNIVSIKLLNKVGIPAILLL